MGDAVNFLQVGSCGFALFRNIAIVGDGHGSPTDSFVFHTHTSLLFYGPRGCGATTYDVSMIASFPCLGTHSWLLPWEKPWPFNSVTSTHC